MSDTDLRQRFVFDQLDARGCAARLENTLGQIHQRHAYPEPLAILINEFTLAACLLRDSIKFDGSLTIQLRTPGALSLLIADCLSDRRLRAVAEYSDDELEHSSSIKLNEMGEGAVLAITITPDDGERYQSIVPIEHPTLAECLEDYFKQSEQLPSRFSLQADTRTAMGIALHALPPKKVADQQSRENDFDRLSTLLATLTLDEAISLDTRTILTLLFHEEYCRLYEAHHVEFGCLCSEDKSLDAIASLGKKEVEAMIKERRELDESELVVDCHFCFQRYGFALDKIQMLYQ